MNDQAVPLGDMTPAELRAFATGYLEAIRDRKAEWDRLAAALEASERALAREKRAADVYYHDAYCDCRKRTVRNVASCASAITWRPRHNGFSGP
jgi:hypothetical protein